MTGTYLIHFGIRGQKWGIRNGPPYPLDKDRSTRKEKLVKIGRDFIKNSGLLGMNLQFFASYPKTNLSFYSKNHSHSSDNLVQYDTRNRHMSDENYEKTVELWEYYDYIDNAKNERFLEACDTYLDDPIRGNQPMVKVPYGDYVYNVINGGTNVYKIIDWRKI